MLQLFVSLLAYHQTLLCGLLQLFKGTDLRDQQLVLLIQTLLCILRIGQLLGTLLQSLFGLLGLVQLTSQGIPRAGLFVL